MRNGKHKVNQENKNYSEFKKDDIVEVKRISRDSGTYLVNGKQYQARVLKGIMSPVSE